MAKKIVVDNAQVSPNTISGAGKGLNSATVASIMMNDSDLISSSRTKIGLKGKDLEDNPSEEGTVADAEQVVANSVYADSEYPILLAQADVTLPPNASTPDVTRGSESAGFFSSQTANWWVAGTGVVIAGAGVGFALSGSDGDNGATVVTNVAPVIISGSIGSVAENAAISTVIYDANATDADAGTTITYSLKAATGDVAALDINATNGEVTLKASADFETKSSYSFTVIASDGTNSSEQAVTVTVTDVNEPPTITSGSTGSVAENAAISTVIYDTNATDADAGTTITYSLKTATGDVAALDINATTGEVTLKASADFETKSSYSFTVIASDGTNSSEQAVIVNVTDLNDNTPIISSGATGSVAENAAISTVIYDANATDADAGTTITYSLKAATGDVAALDINATNGEVTLKASADFETKSSYSFTVIASDGTNSSEQAVTVTVTEVNEPPTITSGSTGSVAENAAISTVIYDANATDADAGTTITYSLKAATGDVAALDINATTGEVTLKASADFETKSSYSFTVIASDGTNSSEQAVTVNVTDNYENVVVEANGAWIDLNANGVRDAEDTIQADFSAGTGNVDLSANPVTIHYNAAPNNPLILTGFGSDDLIEIDAQAFIDNGHNALNILAVPGIKTLDNFRTAEGMPLYTTSFTTPSSTIVKNVHALIGDGEGTFYSNSISYDGTLGPLSSKIGLSLRNNGNLQFFSDTASAAIKNFTLASGLPTDMRLQDMVVFVNLPG